MLEVVGITGTAAQIYSELVKAERLSVAEVAERRGIPTRQAAAPIPPRSTREIEIYFKLASRIRSSSARSWRWGRVSADSRDSS